jgi:hypothetical protein
VDTDKLKSGAELRKRVRVRKGPLCYCQPDGSTEEYSAGIGWIITIAADRAPRPLTWTKAPRAGSGWRNSAGAYGVKHETPTPNPLPCLPQAPGAGRCRVGQRFTPVFA